MDSSILYSFSSSRTPYTIYIGCPMDTVRIITQGVRIRTRVTNTDTPVIYGIKRLNKILKSQ